jgi:hypothetical protein
MQACVTNSTEEDFELHISWPSCSASKQSSKQSDPMGTKKRKKKRKETIQDENTTPNTISFNHCNKNWPVLKNMLITCARM